MHISKKNEFIFVSLLILEFKNEISQFVLETQSALCF